MASHRNQATTVAAAAIVRRTLHMTMGTDMTTVHTAMEIRMRMDPMGTDRTTRGIPITGTSGRKI
jgi:hypothetical protein